MITAMLRRAGALTLCVYALRTAAVVAVGWPLAADWGNAVSQHMYTRQPSPGDAALLLEIAARHLLNARTLAWIAALAIAYAVLAPIVSVAWTHALARSSTVRESLLQGVRRGPQAIGIGAVMLAGWMVLLGGCALLLAYAPPLLPASASAELALRATIVLLAAAGVVVLATLYELACATQAEGRVELTRALRVAASRLSPRLLATRAVLALAIAACFAFAELIGRSAASALGAAGILLLQQSLVFTATTLRAACFALALRRLSPR
jgi:hypothetical protein